MARSPVRAQAILSAGSGARLREVKHRSTDVAAPALRRLDVMAERSRRRRGGTVRLTSHPFGSVRIADRVVVLDERRVVEVGAHENLLTTGSSYARMYKSRAAAYR